MSEFLKSYREWVPEEYLGHTTTTYKFFWVLAIIEIYKQRRNQRIPFYDLVAMMFAKAWPLIQNGEIAFGKVDKLPQTGKNIAKESKRDFDNVNETFSYIRSKSYSKEYRKWIPFFYTNVPYFFLTPWMGGYTSRTLLADQQFIRERHAPYGVQSQEIIINEEWMNEILPVEYDFKKDVVEHLYEYLRQRNPEIENLYSLLQNCLLSNSYKISSVETSTKTTDIKTGTPQAKVCSPSDTAPEIINGKVLRIKDQDLLSEIRPLLSCNKLQALTILCNHYKEVPNLTMKFSDWAVLLDSIERVDNSETNETTVEAPVESSQYVVEHIPTKVKAAPKPKKSNKSEKREIYDEYLSGQPFYSIASKHNISPADILKIVQDFSAQEESTEAEYSSVYLSDIEKEIYDNNTDDYFLNTHAFDRSWTYYIEGSDILRRVFGSMQAFPCFQIDNICYSDRTITMHLFSISPIDKGRYLIKLVLHETLRIKCIVESFKDKVSTLSICRQGFDYRVSISPSSLQFVAKRVVIESIDATDMQ